MFLVTVYHVCEHARTHARMRARSCIENRLSARGCTLVDQGNFALTCVSLGRDPASRRGVRRLVGGCPVCVGSCHCCYIVLVPWREYQFYRGRERVRARGSADFFRLIREGRVVFVSVYALGVCTSASGLWHFLDYLNI